MKDIYTYYIISLIFITTMSTSGFAQTFKKVEKETDDAIIWTKDRRLKLTDFQAEVDTTTSKKALTGANIIIVPNSYKNGIYTYQVFAKFHKDLSWINTTSAYILNHEQLHFDIAELYARKMRRDIQKIKKTTGKVLQSDYRRIHKSLFRSYIYFQKQYDTQTQYSTDQEEQQRWNIIVADDLKKLENFSLDL
ncbi:DUF922 domain-containing protein [Formosa sp. 4Alg 33]|uniref:DUF922 domain-containing protein n=1 Tax=Formosa sp. 4Alg 33 TaxID=3382189 RepID=UPI003D9C3897